MKPKLKLTIENHLLLQLEMVRKTNGILAGIIILFATFVYSPLKFLSGWELVPTIVSRIFIAGLIGSAIYWVLSWRHSKNPLENNEVTSEEMEIMKRISGILMSIIVTMLYLYTVETGSTPWHLFSGTLLGTAIGIGIYCLLSMESKKFLVFTTLAIVGIVTLTNLGHVWNDSVAAGSEGIIPLLVGLSGSTLVIIVYHTLLAKRRGICYQLEEIANLFNNGKFVASFVTLTLLMFAAIGYPTFKTGVNLFDAQNHSYLISIGIASVIMGFVTSAIFYFKGIPHFRRESISVISSAGIGIFCLLFLIINYKNDTIISQLIFLCICTVANSLLLLTSIDWSDKRVSEKLPKLTDQKECA